MSYLADHARAARITAEALETEWHITKEGVEGRPLLFHLAMAFHGAANRMEIEVSAGIVDASCTLNHAAMPTPKCAACGAARP